MVTYLLLDIFFLLPLIGIWYFCGHKLSLKTKPLLATGVTLLLLTAVFDSLIIANRIVAYNPANYLGIHIGMAPLEDFAYALTSAILVPVLWTYFSQQKDEKDGKN